MGKTVGSTQECLMYDWDDVAFIHEGFIKALSKYIYCPNSLEIYKWERWGYIGKHPKHVDT